MWHKMHGQSHTVYHLVAVHLPGKQHVYYQEGWEMQSAGKSPRREMQLTACFELNQLDSAAREFMCCEIPWHYASNLKDTK